MDPQRIVDQEAHIARIMRDFSEYLHTYHKSEPFNLANTSAIYTAYRAVLSEWREVWERESNAARQETVERMVRETRTE